jgi:acyl-CoA synthetase (AMP-forming)/AMP-acid ligase II
MRNAMPEDGLVHTPYGATECLPVACISSAGMSDEVIAATREGAGICVGAPVAPNAVAILRLFDEAVEQLRGDDLLPPGEVGEIIVHGPSTTDSYWRRDEQTRLAKMQDDEGRVWHRMGDVGYFDSKGRLWFCGRKAQRVQTVAGDLFADQVEAIFNTLDGIERTALVGVGLPGSQKPALCVQLRSDSPRGTTAEEKIKQSVRLLAQRHASLAQLTEVLIHPGFPVDTRHNSKIGRETLAAWATDQLQRKPEATA